MPVSTLINQTLEHVAVYDESQLLVDYERYVRVQDILEKAIDKKHRVDKVNGDETVKRFFEALTCLDTVDNGSWRRSKGQRRFHKAMLQSALKRIYMEEFAVKAPKIMKDLDYDEIKQQVIISTPRRFGKTMSVAMFAACALWAIPRIAIAIFSTSRRASRALLIQIRKFFVMLPGGRQMIIKDNEETMWIQGTTGLDDVRVCNSYPSKVEISPIHDKIEPHFLFLFLFFFFFPVFDFAFIFV